MQISIQIDWKISLVSLKAQSPNEKFNPWSCSIANGYKPRPYFGNLFRSKAPDGTNSLLIVLDIHRNVTLQKKIPKENSAEGRPIPRPSGHHWQSLTSS